ncbi:MAG TPA: hypothetical protein VNM66_06415, partial [Thermodesulfobacteriota bacterium]|nr:hypothetical protein [Thermodesulfobacteriota bacterium]
MIAPLQQFIGRLRRAGVRVSPAETLDAAAALAHVDLAERAAVKAALRGTLVKKADQIPLFDALFDLFWTAALPGAGEGTGERPGGGSGRAREGR